MNRCKLLLLLALSVSLGCLVGLQTPSVLAVPTDNFDKTLRTSLVLQRLRWAVRKKLPKRAAKLIQELQGRSDPRIPRVLLDTMWKLPAIFEPARDALVGHGTSRLEPCFRKILDVKKSSWLRVAAIMEVAGFLTDIPPVTRSW